MSSEAENPRHTTGRVHDRDLPGLLQHVEPLAARKFVIAIKRLADDLTYGLDGSRFLGSGIDYVQSRLYQPGDPVKSIDWRVTARSTKVHVKEYEAQRRIPADATVDLKLSGQVDHFFWSVAVNNVFDALYYDYAIASSFTPGRFSAYPLPGRSYLVKAGVTF